MRFFPLGIIEEFLKEIFFMAHLVTFSFAEIQRWTDCDQPIFYSEDWYVRKGFTFRPPVMNIDLQAEGVTMEIDNVDKSFSDLILTEDVREKECRIERVCLDKNLCVIETPIIIFPGYVDRILKADRKRAVIEISDELIRWQILTPRRTHSPTCEWGFKSDECGYPVAGPATVCGDGLYNEKTAEACAYLGNRIHFGGFYYISTLAQKEIWWGTKPKLWG
jgi:hypothetical protein